MICRSGGADCWAVMPGKLVNQVVLSGPQQERVLLRSSWEGSGQCSAPGLLVRAAHGGGWTPTHPSVLSLCCRQHGVHQSRLPSFVDPHQLPMLLPPYWPPTRWLHLPLWRVCGVCHLNARAARHWWPYAAMSVGVPLRCARTFGTRRWLKEWEAPVPGVWVVWYLWTVWPT